MNQERLYQVLVSPHVSEKSTVLADSDNQHVFKVLPDATKAEVKLAVEEIFKVKVEKVSILNIKGKKKSHGGRVGKRSDLRKAYVSIQGGDDIDFAGSK